MAKRSNRIILNSEYYIEIDPLNWILKIKRPSKDRVIGYYSILEDALLAYKTEVTKKSFLERDTEVYINQAIKLLNDIKKLIKTLAGTLKIQK